MKDARGHGSDARGSAMDTALSRISQAFGDKQAAGALAQGHPKSAPVPIHPGAAGLQSIHDTVMANLPKGVSVTHTVLPIRK